MKLKDSLPLSSSGIPLILWIFGSVILFSWPLLSTLGINSVLFFLAGAFFLIASQGTGVEVENDRIILKYVFGLLRIELKNITEISLLSDLRGASIARHLARELILPLLLLVGFTLYLKQSGSAFYVPYILYWIILCCFLLLIPLKKLKQYLAHFMTLSLLLPWCLTWIFIHNNGDFLLSFAISIMGFFYVTAFILSDYILIVSDREAYLLRCTNGKKVLRVLLGTIGGDKSEA